MPSPKIFVCRKILEQNFVLFLEKLSQVYHPTNLKYFTYEVDDISVIYGEVYIFLLFSSFIQISLVSNVPLVYLMHPI